MISRITVLFLAFCCAFVLSLDPAVAQSSRSGSGPASSGPKKRLTNIVFAGLAGAILGLSTLSFYGRPQDNLSNIAVGFAIGIISGTLYTTYEAASEPKRFYRGSMMEREAWKNLAASRGHEPLPSYKLANFEFNF